jgi:hypothetical protein
VWDWWRRLARGSARVLPLLGGLYAASFVACAAVRLAFGFELSWMESGMQAMTDRLSAQLSIYSPPSPAYVPYLYPPLYFYAAHGLGRLLPGLVGAQSLRLVSLAATVATAVVVFRCLSLQCLPLRTRLLVTALFIAFYGRFEFWHDTSRVDSLFVLLLFSAAAVLVESRTHAAAASAGVLAGLAVMCKQPGVPLLVIVAATVAAIYREARRPALFVLAGTATVVATLAATGELRNPWFYFYVLTVPASHPLVARHLRLGISFMFAAMPLFLLATASVLRGPRTSARERAWAVIFAGWTIVLLLLRLKEGANVNFYLPLVPVGLMVAAPFCVPSDARRLAGEPLLLLQFLMLAYNPLRAMPGARDWDAGYEAVASLRRIAGDVFLPQVPGDLKRAGKGAVADMTALCDLRTLRPDLLRDVDRELEAGRYAAAVPWPQRPHDPAGCRLASLDTRFRFEQPFPPRGEIFDELIRRNALGIYRYVSSSAAPGCKLADSSIRK